ncbi:MAG TPA: hypothetical protein VIL49_10160 [Capillimicrobium sp.]
MALARRGLAALALALALPMTGALAAPALAADPPACSTVEAGAQRALMRAYDESGPPTARQAGTAKRGIRSVLVEVPPIDFDGPGTSSLLPVGPCQTIYRFAFPRIETPDGRAPAPLRYAEIDWNTEGIPRGPNGSFASPHFDVHLYLKPRHWVDHHVMCPSSNGRTCDEERTPYEQMRRFMDLPSPADVPRAYFPDTGSSIPMMGLHLLDGRATYTQDAVDHTPTLIYGSFDGEILFAEASVTLQTLQDAVAAPSHELIFPYRQPRRVRGDAPWPTRFVVRYQPQSRTFAMGFTRFRRADGRRGDREASPAQPEIRPAPSGIPDARDFTAYVGKDTGGNVFDIYGEAYYGPNLRIASIVAQPPNGSATLNGGTTVGYTPNLGYCNFPGGPTDDITIAITDGTETVSATVHMNVDCQQP